MKQLFLKVNTNNSGVILFRPIVIMIATFFLLIAHNSANGQTQDQPSSFEDSLYGFLLNKIFEYGIIAVMLVYFIYKDWLILKKFAGKVNKDEEEYNHQPTKQG